MSKQLYGVIATSSDQNEQRLPINPELLLARLYSESFK